MLVCFHTIVGFVDAPASTTPMDWLHLFACKLLLCNQTGFLSESNCMGLGGKDFSSQSALSADTKEESIPSHCDKRNKMVGSKELFLFYFGLRAKV